MAYDDGHAALFRDDLQEEYGIEERRMFGGLCFMMRGNMLCGVHTGGAMFRVGKEAEPEALAIEGARPMDFTGRPMAGFIEVEEDALEDDTRRAALLALAKEYVGAMPAK